ncbi:LPS assembly lipoprotein LptE [Stieleria sp. JC731]|nr:LPS assembly lipoprotein LptE [Stieleria sp. JC731]MCC9598986.1 LPS assembly lipoprotein LptE [Stieleria sp. JC731]
MDRTRTPFHKLANASNQVAFALLLVLAGSCGCASYRFGADAMYPANIRTVHIPVVRNETFRPDLGKQLTEALVSEVQRRTPYKVVSSPMADSVLNVKIITQSKTVLTEVLSDDPRALDTAITVHANWVSRGGQPLMQNSIASLNNDMTGFSQNARFVPEAGQSIDTANLQAIEQLASRIVSQMESRW